MSKADVYKQKNCQTSFKGPYDLSKIDFWQFLQVSEIFRRGKNIFFKEWPKTDPRHFLFVWAFWKFSRSKNLCMLCLCFGRLLPLEPMQCRRASQSRMCVCWAWQRPRQVLSPRGRTANLASFLPSVWEGICVETPGERLQPISCVNIAHCGGQ